MPGSIKIKRGDRLPLLSVVLAYETGDAIDLTTASAVTFNYKVAGASSGQVSRTMTIVNPLSGLVSYQWVSGDTLTAGRYSAEFEITFSSGDPLTVPTTGYIPMIVYEDIATS